MSWRCRIGLHKWGFKLLSVNPLLAVCPCERCDAWSHIPHGAIELHQVEKGPRWWQPPTPGAHHD